MEMLFILLLITFNEILSHSLDPTKFLIHGPGLDSSITLPVRYFFVQLVNKNSENVIGFTFPSTSNWIDAKFQLYKSGKLMQMYFDVIYINDGSFVIRFRLKTSIIHDHVVITLVWLPMLTYIGNSSFILKSPIFSEKCHCPEIPLSNWLSEKLKCPKNYEQILNDFKPFKLFNLEEDMGSFYKQFHPFTSVAVCRYKIKNNQIYRKCYGEHVSFKIFSDAALLSLSHKTILPDIDFLFNLGDWPLTSKSGKPFPMISWCGSTDSNDIVVPSYETMEWVLEMMNRVSLDVFTTLKESIHQWNKKIERAFWRGRDSSDARMNLVRLSLQYRNILDARLTNMFFFQNDSTIGKLEPAISFIDFFKYKYVINMDGTVAAYRFPLSLAGGSLLFKEESKYYEYIYSQLKPDQHYVSIKTDLSDLILKLNWWKDHDLEAYRVTKKTRDFIRQNFMPADVFCYFGRVLEEYSGHLANTDPIVIPSNYDLVTDHMDDMNCLCLELLRNKRVYYDDL